MYKGYLNVIGFKFNFLIWIFKDFDFMVEIDDIFYKKGYFNSILSLRGWWIVYYILFVWKG